MKIVFLSSRSPKNFIGGAEISAFLTAQALQKLGHEVLFIGASEKSGRVESKYRGIRVVELPVPLLNKTSLFKRRLAVRSARDIASEIEKEKPDVIHAHDFHAALALSELKAKSKKVVTVRDHWPVCGTTNLLLGNGQICNGCSLANVTLRCEQVVSAPLIRKPFRIYQYKANYNYRKRAYSKIDHHIFATPSVKEQFERLGKWGVETGKFSVIPNPVMPEYLEDETPYPDNGIILSVGKLGEYKGTTLLLNVFAKVHAKEKQTKLWLVGDGDIEKYKALAEKLGISNAVVFHGKVSPFELINYYRKCSIVVSSSIVPETFGRSIADGMAMGRVVIAPSFAGHKYLVEGGVTGFLYNRSDQFSLLNRISQALNSNILHKKKMVSAAKELCSSKFACESVAKDHLNIYRGR